MESSIGRSQGKKEIKTTTQKDFLVSTKEECGRMDLENSLLAKLTTESSILKKILRHI